MTMNEKTLDQSINDLNDLFVRILKKHEASANEAVAIMTGFMLTAIDTLQKSTDASNQESIRTNQYLIKILKEHMLTKAN